MSARPKSATPPTIETIVEAATKVAARCASVARTRAIGAALSAGVATAAERGAAADKLAAIAAALGITEDEACDYWAVMDVINALSSAAKAEGAIEGAQPAGERTDPAPTPTDPPAQRADGEGDMTPEQMAAWNSDAMMALAAVFGEGTPADLLDKLKASQELFAGAVANAAGGDGNAGGDNAGPGGQGTEGERAAKAEQVAMRGEMSAMRTELGALRADKRRRDIRDEIVRRFSEAQVTVPVGEDLDELTALCEGCEGDAYRKLIERSVRAVNRPPQGTVTSPTPAQRAAAPTTQREALDILREQVLTEQPELRTTADGKARARAIASRRAITAFPALFGKAESAA